MTTYLTLTMERPRPSLEIALGRLRDAGIEIAPAEGTIPGLYVAPGYPELTTNQVLTLAASVPHA